jgi:hypothetical protein
VVHRHRASCVLSWLVLGTPSPGRPPLGGRHALEASGLILPAHPAGRRGKIVPEHGHTPPRPCNLERVDACLFMGGQDSELFHASSIWALYHEPQPISTVIMPIMSHRTHSVIITSQYPTSPSPSPELPSPKASSAPVQASTHSSPSCSASLSSPHRRYHW